MRPSPLEEAMELYQIGRFLELDILSQGCEDLILEYLTLESLPTVLKYVFFITDRFSVNISLSHTKNYVICAGGVVNLTDQHGCIDKRYIT